MAELSAAGRLARVVQLVAVYLFAGILIAWLVGGTYRYPLGHSPIRNQEGL